MNAQPDPAKTAAPAFVAAAPQTLAGRWTTWMALGVAVLALVVAAQVWQKLTRVQEQLAKQSADAGQQSLEAKAWAKQAQDTVKDSAGRLGLVESRLAEVALQRSQLEELIQSLSRSRDETLVVDIEAALRMAQQQAQLTGSLEPLLGALKSAQQRVQRAAQPRLAPVQRAIEKDLERLRTQPTFDLPGLLIRLDEGVALADGLVFANQAPVAATAPRSAASEAVAPAPWWAPGFKQIGEQLMGLVRISRIDVPEAMLLSPEQIFFVRENIKLKLLNARLGLLARHYDAARSDMIQVSAAVRRYADGQSRKTQQMLALLEQSQQQTKASEVPRLDASLAALATAAAGR